MKAYHHTFFTIELDGYKLVSFMTRQLESWKKSSQDIRTRRLAGRYPGLEKLLRNKNLSSLSGN
jgi:hypothetical protein